MHGDPVDGVAWWCSEEDRYGNYCHPGQIEDRRDHSFFGRADRDRFAEILMAHDRHQALRAEVGAKLGVDAAEAEADLEFARLRDLEDKLVAMPAFTRWACAPRQWRSIGCAGVPHWREILRMPTLLEPFHHAADQQFSF
jgi:hypothetical protein